MLASQRKQSWEEWITKKPFPLNDNHFMPRLRSHFCFPHLQWLQTEQWPYLLQSPIASSDNDQHLCFPSVPGVSWLGPQVICLHTKEAFGKCIILEPQAQRPKNVEVFLQFYTESFLNSIIDAYEN